MISRQASLPSAACVLLASAACLLTVSSARAEVFWEVDFGGGDAEAVVGDARHELLSGSIDAVANPAPDAVNGSAMVGRIRVENSEDKVRAEIGGQRLPTDGHTYRYRWSYYIPSAIFEGTQFDWFVTSQWKTWPCEVCNEAYDPAICGGCGGIFNDLGIDDGEWGFRWRAEPDCHEHAEPLALDRWVRFEMLVYWTQASDGYVRLWRDGELVESLDDIRTLFTSFEPDTCDMYWALGFYAKWYGSQSHLDIYLDDLQISDDTEPPVMGGSGQQGADSTAGSGQQGADSTAGSGQQGADSAGGSGNASNADDDGSSGSGCGCRVGAGGFGGAAWLGVLLAVGGVLLRRRRRASTTER